MTNPTLDCLDDRRRHEVRRRHRNGLDYLEVSDDQLKLTVYFLGFAPEGLTRDNVRITGGRRIRDIRVTDVEICPQVDPELDNCMVVTVDKPGDFSTYTLCLVNLPDDAPFDPRYRCLDFSFKVACPTDLDCKTTPVCPPDKRIEPELSYLAKDYASFRRLILDRLAAVMPDWTERHVPDVGITLVELLAYVGDYLSYYQDAAATEAYLSTARQRISVRRHARLVDYPMYEGCNARAWLHVKTSADVTLPAAQLTFLTGFDRAPKAEDRLLTWDDLHEVRATRYEAFEPLVDDPDAVIHLYAAHNEIHFYTWGDAECCLPRGATAATLVDGDPSLPGDPGTADGETGPRPPAERVLHLGVGDVLIFEEAIGPKTGDPDDADPTRRHAVRLTSVRPVEDELYGQPLLEIEWADADALPFALCLSTIGPPPDCALLTDITVARGNVLLVDHGRRRGPEILGCVPQETEDVRCKGEGRVSDVVRHPGRFRPHLQAGPLTFSQPVPPAAPAAAMLRQDPRKALPWTRLVSYCDPDCLPGNDKHQGQPETTGAASRYPWTVRADLFASAADDYHYVVEMDDAGRAHLRFGDGELGRLPEVGQSFEARYRVGNGPAGNVGADTITLAVSSEHLSGITLRPRNPLPAHGGIAPEPIAEVTLFAPQTFRHELARAITADDYARLAERHPAVQRSAAELRWNGSWYEVRVAIDPSGRAEADAALLDEIAGHLYAFRRIGHDLVVRPARYVPLDLVLEVCVAAGFLRGHVKAALLARFGTRLLPDGSLGFFHPDALSFGDGISLSRLVAAAQAVPGVESVTVTRLERLFEGPHDELEQGVLPLGPLEVARLDSDPSFPENGRIRFELRGGR